MAQPLQPPAWVKAKLREGQVIPAHPLALTANRRFDERHQRALTRYYHAAGCGGIAVGVHTTQFEIRKPQAGLFRPVLELARHTIIQSDATAGTNTVCIAGICGRTDQATTEAQLARELGYHAGLLSLAALPDASDSALLAHCRAVAQEIPLFGFYLQPAAGGRLLSQSFWRSFATIENLIAIKIAPFNRYHTLDVLRAVAAIGRSNEISLYTGNDDNILPDLITEFACADASGKLSAMRIVGGLLGHWAFWTRRAIELLERCKQVRQSISVPAALLRLGAEITDVNAAVFDAAHDFKGCIAGINEMLRRQGLLTSNLCLNPEEALSHGQAEELTRVEQLYPHLSDREFVQAHLSEWLKD